MKMKWENAYDIRASKNSRGENVYDVYKKDTEEMIWADIPVVDIDAFLSGMVDIVDRVATEEFDKMFSGSEEEDKQDTKPMNIPYTRHRGYEPFAEIIDENDKDEDAT